MGMQSERKWSSCLVFNLNFTSTLLRIPVSKDSSLCTTLLFHKQSPIHTTMNSFQDIKVKKPIGCKQPGTQFTLGTLWDLAWTYAFQDSFSAWKDRWQGSRHDRIQERKTGDLGCAGTLAFECAQQVACFLQRRCQRERMQRNCWRTCKHSRQNAPAKEPQPAKSHGYLSPETTNKVSDDTWDIPPSLSSPETSCALVALPYPNAVPRICWQTL